MVTLLPPKCVCLKNTSKNALEASHLTFEVGGGLIIARICFPLINKKYFQLKSGA